ncbi:hypothetical protein B0J14DRAFT_668681 [Halenospora varia]|nr:hypothetical protein B0J14DRAFT_668681 [Halenospora varia]
MSSTPEEIQEVAFQAKIHDNILRVLNLWNAYNKNEGYEVVPSMLFIYGYFGGHIQGRLQESPKFSEIKDSELWIAFMDLFNRLDPPGPAPHPARVVLSAKDVSTFARTVKKVPALQLLPLSQYHLWSYGQMNQIVEMALQRKKPAKLEDLPMYEFFLRVQSWRQDIQKDQEPFVRQAKRFGPILVSDPQMAELLVTIERLKAEKEEIRGLWTQTNAELSSMREKLKKEEKKTKDAKFLHENHMSTCTTDGQFDGWMESIRKSLKVPDDKEGNMYSDKAFNRLTKAIESFQADKLRAADQVNSAKQNTANVQKQLDEKIEELREARAMIANHDDTQRKLSSAEEKIGKLEAEILSSNAKWSKKLVVANTALGDAQFKLKASQAETAAEQDKHGQTKIQAQQQLAEDKEINQKTLNSLSEQRKTYIKIKVERDAAVDAIQVLQRKVDSEKDRTAAAVNAATFGKDETIAHLEEQLQLFIRQNGALDQAGTKTAAALAKKEQEIQTLRQAFDKRKIETSNAAIAAVSAKEQTIVSLEEELRKLQDINETLEGEHNDMTERLADQQQPCKNLEQDLEKKITNFLNYPDLGTALANFEQMIEAKDNHIQDISRVHAEELAKARLDTEAVQDELIEKTEENLRLQNTIVGMSNTGMDGLGLR